MEKKEDIFSFSDAWVLTCLLYGNITELNLTDIILVGDMLIHAILMDEELKNAFFKFQKYGILKIQGTKVFLTETGQFLKDYLTKYGRGLFSQIELVHKKLNSSRMKYQINTDDISKCDFITVT